MLRATLKSLLARKLRLGLAATAVVLGVAFVCGAFVLTDTLGARFEKLFTSVNQNVDVYVQPDREARGDAEPPRLTQEQYDRLAGTPGVAYHSPEVVSLGVVPFKDNGKPVTTQGPPAIGVGVSGNDPFALIEPAEGEMPDAPGEVALTRFTAEQAEVELGEQVKIFYSAEHEPSWFRVVGILVYSGNRDTLGGETLVAFELKEAQRLFYGQEGLYNGIYAHAESGVSQTELKNRMAANLPVGFTASTGDELNKEQASDVKEALGFFQTFLLTFAFIALFVGVFVILVTFSILVAQRVRELALFRSMGASRRQVMSTVLLESVVVGLVGSTLGLLAGLGLALLLQFALDTLLNLELPGAGLIVKPTTVLWSYLAGTLTSVVAALFPAWKASRVAPLEAMRDVVKPNKPLVRLAIVGGVLLLGGSGLVARSLAGWGDLTMPVLGVGVLLGFVGVTLLSPLFTRPVAGLIGKGFSWGAASHIGHRNAQRNPRRTALTAAMLMIGVTLVTALATIGASIRVTTTQLVEETGADVVVDTQLMEAPNGKQGFDPAKLEQARQIPGVIDTTAVHFTVARVNGDEDGFVQAADLRKAGELFGMHTEAGELRVLQPGEMVVDKEMAKEAGFKLGQTVRVEYNRGTEMPYRIIGVYSSRLFSGPVIGLSEVQHFAGPLALFGLVQLDAAHEDGAQARQIAGKIENLMANYPFVTVTDRAGYIEQVNSEVNVLLGIFYVLLALAIIIAVLGVINVLLLSVYERTRELGMLRAIGMLRRQVKRMVRIESVILAGFGCVLGLALGLGLGAAVSYAMIKQDDLIAIGIPWLSLPVFAAGALVAGLVAAWWPAFRASRLNILEAITYE